MSAFARAAAALFADRNLAEDGLWKAAGIGPGAAVRVIRRAPDEVSDWGGGQIASDTTLLEVQVAQAPDLAESDVITIGPQDYILRGEPVRDADRLIWTVQARPL